MSDQRNEEYIIELKDSDKFNRQLLQNQSFLYNENQKLKDDVSRLTKQLEEISASKLNREFLNCFEREKKNLLYLNEALKKKLRRMRSPIPSDSKKDKSEKSKSELCATINELDRLIERVRLNDKFEMKPQENHAADVIDSLTKKLEEEQKNSEESKEALRKLREDDEKYTLREKITDMKQLLTDIEVENTKLKYENEQLTEDVDNFKKQLNEAVEEAKATAKKLYALEDEKDQLKQIISDLEDEKIRLKKDMIEEMNEANRAKRVSIDTEIALQHISEAYENKRKEVKKLSRQLEDAEKIIKEFKEQFEPVLY